METTVDTISVGDYIVLQRQKYTKLHKFSSLDSTAMLGKDLLELRNIASKPYFTTFKMVPKIGGRGKRVSTLEPCTDKSDFTENIIASKGSGIDNRNITDDGSSQTLTPDEIQKLRDECSSSSQIVSQIVENSKTFASKTEYSQEKYLKKKEKKYFEFVQIRRPNIRLIADIMYRQSAEKIYGIRMDQLSQMVSYSGVCGIGNYLVYESGTNGLVPATLLNSIGSNTEATLVHMHPGNVPQKQALLALNLKQEQLSRCVSVNVYSVLRQYYQGTEPVISETILESGKRKLDPEDETNAVQPAKLLKLDVDVSNGSDVDENKHGDADGANENISERDEKPPATNKEQWMVDNERACAILKDQVDALVICAKEHPSTILKALLPFVKPSRPIVIYNTSREILADLYLEMKGAYSVTNLKITSNWMRSYQILPNRTHPEINMTSNSGFLLTGYTDNHSTSISLCLIESSRVRTRCNRETLFYGTERNENVDVFGIDLPSDAPIVVYIHGGYWQQLTKEMSAYCVDPLVSNGFKVFVVEYDLCPRVTLNKIVEQITECGKFILDYAQRKKCCQLTFCGHSAGAHLILCMIENLQRTSVTPIPIDSLFLISGIYDLTELRHTSINANNILSIDSSNIDNISPLKFDYKRWSHQQFTVYICMAEHDSPTFIKQSLKLLNRLNGIGMKTKLRFVENCDHFDIVEKLSDKSFELTQILIKNRPLPDTE